MNEKGQIVTWQLTQTQGFENIRLLLQQLFWRISSQGKIVKEFYINNCCHWKKKLQEVFWANLVVKLDIFQVIKAPPVLFSLLTRSTVVVQRSI